MYSLWRKKVFQPDIRRTNILCLVEGWLSGELPSRSIVFIGFSVRTDFDPELSQNKTVGRMCLIVTWAQCNDGSLSTVNTVYYPNLECLLLQCCPSSIIHHNIFI